MATCLEKNCAFRFLYVSFVDVYKFVSVLLSFFILRVGCGLK